MLDIWEEGITETRVPKKDKIQTLCIYTEFIVLPDGTVKRNMIKSWVKNQKYTKPIQTKMASMPNVEVGAEVLL